VRTRNVFLGKTDEAVPAMEPAVAARNTNRGSAESAMLNQAENKILRIRACIAVRPPFSSRINQFDQGSHQSK
jgi:hypothetical protein